MKKGIWILIVIILILGTVCFLYYLQYGNDVSILNKIKDSLSGFDGGDGENDESSNENDIISDLNGRSSEGAGGDSDSGADSDSKSVGIEEDVGMNYSVELPLDLYDSPCGFYFAEYGVCSGVCPSGVCSLEGGSCYCKKV